MISPNLQKFENTHLLREAALRKMETGNYTQYAPDTPKWFDFWEEEARRCKEGFTAGDISITGLHYFFLNYHPLDVVPLGEQKGRVRKEWGLPNFWALHYDFFWALEKCQQEGKNICILKPRRSGFSEIAAAIGAHEYTFYPKSKSYYIAFAKNFLIQGGVLSKVWDNLEWLNTETDNYFMHLSQKKNTEYHRKSSYLIEDDEHGPKSEVIGMIVDHPRKVRGYAASWLFIEEAGSYPNLKDVLNAASPLVEEGGIRTGTMVMWGTGGEDGPGIEALKDVFRNPESWDFMGFDDHFGNGERKVSYFFPAYYTMSKYMDKDGNPDLEASKKELEEVRDLKKKTQSAHDYTKFAAERPFTPGEALVSATNNQFNQAKLADQIIKLELQDNYPEELRPRRVKLHWIRNSSGGIDGVYAEEATDGPIEIIEEPHLTPDGQHYKGLYIAGLDSIDQAQDDSTSKNRSDLCIVVKKRFLNVQSYGNIYVCSYRDRPKDINTAYENVLKILWWYNCNVNLEYTKKEITQYFRKYKQSHRFVRRPAAVRNDPSNSQKTKLIGTPATTDAIDHADRRLKHYIQDYCESIYFLSMLYDLKDYNRNARTKYDAAVAMGLCELADEDMMEIIPRSEERPSSKMQKFGYYRDPKTGYKKRGILPGQEERKDSVRWVDRRDSVIAHTHFE